MIRVSYVDHMGSDERVCDAARVSFDKAAADRNERLLAFLAHCFVTVRVAAPIFVRPQCFKSKIGFTENEVSRRDVDGPVEVFVPKAWRSRSDAAKQGSGGPLEARYAALATQAMEAAILDACEAYARLLDLGVAPEQARMVLPQAAMTEWIWTGSLAAWARFCALRLAPDAQAETGEVARLCAEIVEPLFPVSWRALTGRGWAA